MIRAAPITPARVTVAAVTIGAWLQYSETYIQMLPQKTRAPFLALVFICAAFLFFVAPIPQDPAYHNFADRRGFCCRCGHFGFTDDKNRLVVPNFMDVASNVFIFGGGFFGLLVLALREYLDLAGDEWQLSVCLPILFASTAIITFGSMYYHWRPCNDTLVWDRLPMTVAFMAIFSFLLDERLSTDSSETNIGHLILYPLIVMGMSSVVWWHFTDDLRPYALVSILPLICIPILLAIYAPKYSGQEYILIALFWYVVAKIGEEKDHEIYILSGKRVSGHSLKHIFAGFVPFTLSYMLIIRQPLVDSE
uniref:Alkaline ceramidase n=1 Tax=Helicotheca tamesis TaxID=374047 RepID=A0A7S2MGY7_9STRA|mmetsp:Transcript_15767/g.21637  ORF Transcript_15767/g.21637 Transcript_15767/m.21637 type:complete len:307 (+) Transcript_15767:34-954(+)